MSIRSVALAVLGCGLFGAWPAQAQVVPPVDQVPGIEGDAPGVPAYGGAGPSVLPPRRFGAYAPTPAGTNFYYYQGPVSPPWGVGWAGPPGVPPLFVDDGYYGPGYLGGPPYAYGRVDVNPLVIPSETMFGLGAAMRRIYGAAALPVGGAVPLPGQAAVPLVVNGVPPQRPAIREPNAEMLALAWRFIGYGDEQFGRQRYHEASQRYRKAVEAAPGLVEAHFRQGQAYLATGKHEAAAAAFKRGMRLGPKWTEADFPLEELYGANRLARTTHVEALAGAAELEPHDGDLLLLVGLQLYFGGEPQRGEPFFRQAQALLQDETLFLDAALK